MAEAAVDRSSKSGLGPAGRPFSTFERLVAWRYLRARRKEAFISVIAGFSFVGIMLGVATLIIVMAVMNGFRTELVSRILGINGHMIVQPVDGPFTDYAALSGKFSAVPGVKMALPLVEGQVLASARAGGSTCALVRGARADDLSKLKSFSYAALPECDQRITCILGMKTIYHLKNIKFVPLGNVSVYTLLDQGKATGGDGFSTDPLQLDPKYTTLVDDKHIFGFQNVAPVVKSSLLSGSSGALLEQTLNNVSAKLTLPAMQAMNKAYYVNKQTPKQIAKKFLQANGLA